jgi:catechol 2,3-dioxygenase-like lactoylglutathione lyase family enzyme
MEVPDGHRDGSPYRAAHDPVASAKLLADLLGVPWEAARGHFTPVYVDETLTLGFASRDRVDSHHYCFRVSDAEFNAIFDRVTATGIKYRSQPTGPEDMRINARLGGRNIYWNDANGHVWEILTISYVRPESSTVAARTS